MNKVAEEDTEGFKGMNAWIGIDIAKETLEACLILEKGKLLYHSGTNTAGGHAQLLKWVTNHAPQSNLHFCMEATGNYSQGLALFLSQTEHKVSVVNPARIHFAGLSRGSGNKTDRADARIIAEFCRMHNPDLWRAAEPEVRVLISLTRRLESLQNLRTQEKNRLGELSEPELTSVVRQSLEESISFFEQQITTVENQIRTHIDNHPDLRGDKELLLSIPGIGETTAAWILAELPAVESFASAQSVAAFAGLAPRQHRSGTSVHKQTQLSKRGSSNLRRALYMPAMTACRYNPILKSFYERLVSRGLARKAALGAVMRKLLMIAFGILKSRRPFDAKILCQNT